MFRRLAPAVASAEFEVYLKPVASRESHAEPERLRGIRAGIGCQGRSPEHTPLGTEQVVAEFALEALCGVHRRLARY